MIEAPPDDERGERLRLELNRAFDRAVRAAWLAERSSDGTLNAEYIALARVLPDLRALATHRAKYLGTDEPVDQPGE